MKKLLLAMLAMCHSVGAIADFAMPTNLFNLPVFVEVPLGPNNRSFGSGFLVATSNYMFLVTARHVLFELPPGTNYLGKDVTISWLSTSWTNTSRITTTIDLEKARSNNLVRVHPAGRDVCAVALFGDPLEGQLLKLLEGGATHPVGAGTMIKSIPDHHLRRMQDVRIAGNVYVFGYPTAVDLEDVRLRQVPLFHPLIRQGIVSGIISDTRTIVIDAAAYGGNSGGPVLEVVELGIGSYSYNVIGVITKFIPFIDRWQSTQFKGVQNVTIANSGYAIVEPTDSILEVLR